MNRTELDRRHLLLSTASLSGMALRGGAANAQISISPLTFGNAGFFRFRLGEFSATVLSDGLIGGPPRIYASDAPEAELVEVLRQAFLPTDQMTLNLNTLLLEMNGKRVLLEAGAGQTMGPRGGRIFQNLAAIGLSANDIDVIVVSHTHPDHVGNLRDASSGKAFPRATVLAPKADWDFFIRNDPDLSFMPVSDDFRRSFVSAIKRSMEPVMREIELYDPESEIVPGLQALAAPGHTPGMANFLVHSRGEQLLLTADLAYHPLINVNRPWVPGPDRDKETALLSRRRLFDRAAVENMLVLGFHYPFPGLGRIRKLATGYLWVPSSWQF